MRHNNIEQEKLAIKFIIYSISDIFQNFIFLNIKKIEEHK